MKPKWITCDCNKINDCKHCSLYKDLTDGAKMALVCLRAWEGHPMDFRDRVQQMLKEMEASK